MQLVHFDFNRTLFELHDDYYVLKAMEFCDRPRRDIATLNVTEGGEGSSLSGLHQLQVPPSVSSVSIRPLASPPLPGILKLTGHHYNHHYNNDTKCYVEIDSLAKVNDTQFPSENSEYVSTAATVASLSDLSQFSNRNVTRKLTPISPGRYVLKRPRNLHCGDLNKATVTGSNENQSFYLECDENGEDCDVPDNDLDPNVEIDGLPKVNDTQFPLENSEYVSAAATGATVVTSQYWDIGEPTCICEHCGAMMWYEERVQKQYRSTTPTFAMCCSHGRITIPHYLPLPQPLNDLFHKHDKRSKYFLDNIRSFNSMFAFTSMGGKVNKSINDGNAPPTFVMNGENYHQIGSLLPLPGIQPKFAQLYIYDTENEISNRMSVVRMKDNNSSLKATIVDDIMKVLDNHNPYAQTYRMIRDKMSENDVPILKLRILAKRGCDGRRYNLPTTSEVAALIVGDFDAADFERDIIVETQSGSLKRVSVFEPSYLPLQYPVLFPRGEDGYRNDIQLNDDSNAPTIKRKTITLREWFAYRIQQRIIEQSTLLFSRRLFHQFLVDAYSMIESSRLKWVRTHQKDLRVEMYKGLTEAILRGEITPSTVGKRIVPPSSFVGGARYMFQNYQDAMTICGWAGYPDLFITFTCNHKWPELCGFLSKYKLKSEDRPDLVCRLFKIKLDHLIKKGEIFGKVKAVSMYILMI
ncbi:uncharacterized protein [Medicago truncatula]|uniref:uncharacterized protein isoform X3 n=1 Tax=Medicago truncatula TaxID=3880 RepID=UPI001968475C|nr:uncharacterized protein LOC112416305 isoform X3 [Medicago truncatula]